MLRGPCSAAVRTYTRRMPLHVARISSSSRTSSQGPNAPLDLDPSLQELLRDADMSLLKHRPTENAAFGTPAAKELEILDFDETWTEQTTAGEEHVAGQERKSARATFGSRGIGSVFLPTELREAVEKIIDEGDRSMLHVDAKRLFFEEEDDGTEQWHTDYEAEYKSWKQTKRHADRDGTAFASVALPAHYSATYAVLDHVKHRLGDDWKIQSIMDWGAGVGSGLWATMHAFQEIFEACDIRSQSEPLLSTSTISSYLGFERRDGLSSMAKKLVEASDIGAAKIRWHRGYSDSEQVQRSDGGVLLALSSFHLSSLPTFISRKEMVKQMWSSGADVIVLIDHDTPAGFANVAEAREQLLRLGRKDLENREMESDPRAGCHVVAPCPHDGICPLFNSGKPNLQCSFSQRLQRPAFMRKTKHVKAGHEDIGYCYVVIRRGQRPKILRDSATVDASRHNIATDAGSLDSIRLEAYNWPRMVFPPLKRSGHVIIDGCTSEGKIMRMTIPRSQGKQPYYDARKSSWGDLFPHKPKNKPQVRMEPKTDTGNSLAPPGSDIGKRRVKPKKQAQTSYAKIYSELKENKKAKRRDWDESSDAP